MVFYGGKFLVLGLSKSGIAATTLLLSHGATVYIYDQFVSARVKSAEEDLSKAGAICVRKENLDRTLMAIDTLVLSPGIAIDNSIAVRAHVLKKRIIGELELGSYFLQAPAIAVTGTNGKTTTVCMIESILKCAEKETLALGNVGVPLCKKVESLSRRGVAVIEVSSFQMETTRTFLPHIACLTNITEDHLNRHYTMGNYVYLKKRLFTNLRESEYAVLNAECPYSREIAETTRAKVVYFSTQRQTNGAYASNGKIYYGEEFLFAEEALSLKEKHNVENALCAIAAAKAFGVENESIRAALSSFRGARHRMEFVACKQGISYVNDSKATNTDAALAAARCMKRATIMLLGGSDKGYSFREFFEELKETTVRYVVLYGENREKLAKECSEAGYTAYSIVENLRQATAVASTVAKAGETILLSPASASFDEFSGYDERGEAFIRYINGEEDCAK